MTKQQGKDFLLEWNYRFPLDRWWRSKYNIPIFSPSHLEISQLDIALEYLEEKLFEEFKVKAQEEIEKEKKYNQGIWIESPEIPVEEESEWFDKIDVSKINNSESKIKVKE